MSAATRRASSLRDIVECLRDSFVPFFREVATKFGFSVETEMDMYEEPGSRAAVIILKIKVS